MPFQIYIYCMLKARYFVLCACISSTQNFPHHDTEKPPPSSGWCEREVVHWSTFFTRSTTGTDVHGIIPRSVMTRSTKSGGVTSYTRLSRPSEGTSCQCSSWVVPVRVTMRSSGSSGKDRWRLISLNYSRGRIEQTQHLLSKNEQAIFFPYLVHWTRRNPSAPSRKTCRSHNTPVQAR